MKSATLHIGAPKTGSSYLQIWLAKNASILPSLGIAPLPLSHAHRLAVEFCEDIQGRPDVINIRNSADMTDVLASFHAHFSNVVSSEYFFHANAEKLASMLGRERVEVATIVCFLRRQDILAASGYAQDVKALKRASPPPNQTNYHREMDYAEIYRSWRSAFPDADIRFLNYDRVKNDLLSSFKAAIRVNGSTNDILERQNISLSAEMTEVARMLNERGIRFDIGALLALQKNGNVFSFSPELTAQFEASYLVANKDLAEIAPGEFDEFISAGWVPPGRDMTGQINEDRLQTICAKLAISASTQ